MTIKDMHYDVKHKLNKIDSQQYKNLLGPEIDWLLNEAAELFVKIIAKPRQRSYLGFEIGQRSIDDIRTIVVRPESDPVACIKLLTNVAALPGDYWHFVKGYVKMDKGNCTDVRGRLIVRQHDDMFEESPFDKSSFEWRKVNGVFFDGGIKLYDDGTFENKTLCITYIRRMEYMHNAEDFRAGGYLLPSGVALTGTQDCELPPHTHREIVDIAVQLASTQMNNPDYQLKLQKLGFNGLK